MFKVGDIVRLKEGTGFYTTEDMIKVTHIRDDGKISIVALRDKRTYKSNSPDLFEHYKTNNLNLK